MLNHYFILCKIALFTKEHYVLAHYKLSAFHCALCSTPENLLAHCYCSVVVDFSLRYRAELTNQKL